MRRSRRRGRSAGARGPPVLKGYTKNRHTCEESFGHDHLVIDYPTLHTTVRSTTPTLEFDSTTTPLSQGYVLAALIFSMYCTPSYEWCCFYVAL